MLIEFVYMVFQRTISISGGFPHPAIDDLSGWWFGVRIWGGSVLRTMEGESLKWKLNKTHYETPPKCPTVVR